ncbi:MAG: DUF2344 domain-containing protein [Oscillospiraceae bacterium]|nr:DUF2344 domain-containing protein [Oscillospiraceae bacterium]
MPSVNTRVFFSKMDRAKYISHLDLNHCVQRAMRRSKLPVWQTEGFNPHTYVAFMLPLSLGQEGVCEAMDFRLTEDVAPEEVMQKLNDSLPPDIRVIRVAEPKYKNTDITTAEYTVESDIDAQKFLQFMQSEKIEVEKKTKRGVSTVDLKPLVTELSAQQGEIKLRLPAGNDFSINPQLLFDAYMSATGDNVSRLRIVRTRVFCADGNEFC